MNKNQTLNDDCMIIEEDIKSITIPDSPREETEIVIDVTDGGGGGGNMEDGEVDDVEFVEEGLQSVAETKAQAIFEITFAQKSDFNRLGFTIIEGLKQTLNANAEDKCYKLNIAQQIKTSEGIKIQAFETAKEAEELNIEHAQNVHDKAADTTDTARSITPDFTGLAELFYLDAEAVDKPKKAEVPSYKRSLKFVLNDDEEDRVKRQKLNDGTMAKRPSRSKNCFNCGSNEHDMRQCDQPRNEREIARSKKDFHKMQERYHADAVNTANEQITDLKPGQLSEDFKKAMGLRRGELPFFFYRMRALGYPPAWLEESIVHNSGLSIITGEEAKNSANTKDDYKFDVGRIVDFPGFNVDPGHQFYDDYRFHQTPPFNPNHAKTKFIEALGYRAQIEGYERKKLADVAATEDKAANTTITSVADMELEDENEQVQLLTIAATYTNASNEKVAVNTESANKATCTTTTELREKSPSLEYLEEQQRKLLEQLRQNTSVIDIDDSLIDEVLELDQTIVPEKSTSVEETQKVDDTAAAPANTSQSVSVEAGTPILKLSKYDRLPTLANFAVGVTDIINFENLPDSTGKYQQMENIISKVRNYYKNSK